MLRSSSSWKALRSQPRRRWLHHEFSVSVNDANSNSDSRKRVALVGTGRMGEIRLTNIQKLSQELSLAAIVDASFSDLQIANKYEQQYNTQCFASLEDARSVLETVHGVWIATPTPTHLEVITKTLQYTSRLNKLCAIGIEKPVAGTLQEIDSAYKACSQARVHLMCSFQRRFDPSYQSLRRQCVDDHQLGALQSVHTVFRDHPCPPIAFLKTGGDPFHDLAVHDIDFVCSLVREYPSRVYAHGTSLSKELRDAKVMDKASVWLEFPTTGMVCTMDVSRRADYGYDQRIEVSGERGMLQVLNPPATSVVHASATGVTHDVAVHSFPERFQEAYALEMEHFVDVVNGRRHPLVHWHAARMATVIAEAARIAAVNKKIVTIKYDKTRQDDPQQDPYVDVEYEY